MTYFIFKIHKKYRGDRVLEVLRFAACDNVPEKGSTSSIKTNYFYLKLKSLI